MGFNYLQTDDRDDYFDSLLGNRKPSVQKVMTLFDVSGNVVTFKGDKLENVRMYKIRNYAKKNYIPHGTGAKRVWRKYLTEEGYTIKTTQL